MSINKKGHKMIKLQIGQKEYEKIEDIKFAKIKNNEFAKVTVLGIISEEEQEVLLKINHIDEIASYIGVDKIIPRAVVDDENKVKFVKPTKYKVENDNTEIIGLGNELENSEKVLEISEINTQYGVVDFIHRMSNKIIKPIDGRKNGSIDINPKTIDIALNSLKNIGDEEARNYLHYELSKWKNGDFENGVLVHNYVWHMLDGNIGKALSLDAYEVNKIKSKYFK